MSDNTIPIDKKRKSAPYNKNKDAPRMSAYMKLVRAKNKAGYHAMTVREWQAAGCPGCAELSKSLQSSAA